MKPVEALCRIRPVFGDSAAIERLFADMGFSNYRQITIVPNGILVEFDSAATAFQFRETFDGRKIRGHTLQADVERQKESQPSDSSTTQRKRAPGEDATKTVIVKNYPPDKLTERRMYELFWQCGYIKDIEVNPDRGVAYLRFDQESDATAAVKRFHQKEVDGATLNISYVKDRALNVPKVMIPIRKIIPTEQPNLSKQFQTEIREFCHDT